MNIKGVRANLLSQGMKVLFSPLRVRKSYGLHSYGKMEKQKYITLQY